MPFLSNYLSLPSSRKVHYIFSKPDKATKTAIVATHGLGSNSSFWLPAFEASGLAADREIYIYDHDGHGLSEFSGREPHIDNLVTDLSDILDALGLKRVVLAGHSMQGITMSLFAEKHPERVEKIILLNCVRNFAPAVADVMRGRADAAHAGLTSLSNVANGVSSVGVAKSQRDNHTLLAFIRYQIASTKPEAYASACLALANAPPIDSATLPVPVHIIGGAEDYVAAPADLEAWAASVPSGKGQVTILDNVGHWGAVEAPAHVGEAMAAALA